MLFRSWKAGRKQTRPQFPIGQSCLREFHRQVVLYRNSITIRQRVQQTGDGYFSNSAVAQTGSSYQNPTGRVSSASDTFSAVPAEEEQATTPFKYRKSRKWALKAALGTSLPKGDYNMPLTAAVPPTVAYKSSLGVLPMSYSILRESLKYGACGRHANDYTEYPFPTRTGCSDCVPL